MPRINGYFCFFPEKTDRLDVEGEGPHIPPSRRFPKATGCVRSVRHGLPGTHRGSTS